MGKTEVTIIGLSSSVVGDHKTSSKMEKNKKSRREQLIEAYKLTKQEIAYLDLCHTDIWFTHKEPQMYIMSARRALTKYHCSECGCEISENEHEDYGMCNRCRESFGD